MEIDWFTFAAQLVNFGILVFLLNHFLYEPVTRAMDLRQRNIDKQIHDSAEKQEHALEEAERFRKLSGEIEREKKDIMDTALEEAAEAKKTLAEVARTEVQSLRNQWIQDLDREKSHLSNLIKVRVGEQVINVSRKALHEMSDTELEERVVATFSKRVRDLADSELEEIRQLAKGSEAELSSAFQLSENQKSSLNSFLGETLGIVNTNFSVTTDLVCGIELRVAGYRIAWSIDEFLESMGNSLDSVFSGRRPAPEARRGGTDFEAATPEKGDS